MNWILPLSYFVHLIATVIWLGGLVISAVIALPAYKQNNLSENQWTILQAKLIPWINGSLIVLLISGFYQMTVDSNYTGFLSIDSTWAWALLLKHVAFIGMVLVTVYEQFKLYPEMKRMAMLAESGKSADIITLTEKSTKLLRLNLILAGLILFFTAIATAV